MQTFRGGLRRLAWDHTATSTLALLVAFVVVDRVTLRFAELGDDRLDDPSLLLAAVRSHWLITAGFVVVVLALGPRRLVATRWSDLHGQLRWFAAIPLAFLVWRRAAGAYDFVFAEWHVFDRLLLVAFALAALARPVALLGVVVVARILVAPVVATIAAPGVNIDELIVLVLLILAVAALLTSRSPTFSSPAVVPVMVAAFGAQFFLPGRIKLRSGWAWHNAMDNLPLNGYAQGWLGSGSGAFAEGLSELIASIEPLLAAGTLAFELGVVVAVFSRRLTTVWLGIALVFHAAVLASLGFLFVEFAAVEIPLMALLATEKGRRWSISAFRGAAPVLAAAAIVLGPIVFHPPSLAWFDSEAVVRYVIDGVDENGDRWALEASDFAPYSGLMAFSALELGPTPPVVSAYGAASRARFDEIRTWGSLDELERFEAELVAECSVENRDASVRLLERFLVTGGSDSWLDRIRPPGHFLTSRPGPDYAHTTLRRLEVVRLTVLRTATGTLERREDVVTLTRTGDGEMVEVEWAGGGTCDDRAG